jgi:glycosyltransferase A (GT-A) superfamily protein (DUF2064 family)
MSMPRLTLFIRRDCHLCDAAEQLVRPISQRCGVRLDLADIDDPATPDLLRAHYDRAVPVLHLNGREIARQRIDPETVERCLEFSQTIVVVLSKFPEPGRVKTRLTVGERVLTPQQAAGVHRVSLLHLLRRLSEMQPSRLVLCFDPPDSADRFQPLLAEVRVSGPAAPVELLPQSAGDLGGRISSAYESLCDSGHPVLFLGVDSPDVPTEALLEAAHRMATSAGTLGPTPDGGYWCIGLSAKLPVRSLLNGIPWSSGSEYTATLERFASAGYSLPPCPAWDDVDHPADLHRLMERLVRSPSADDRLLYAAIRDALGGSTS